MARLSWLLLALPLLAACSETVDAWYADEEPVGARVGNRAMWDGSVLMLSEEGGLRSAELEALNRWYSARALDTQCPGTFSGAERQRIATIIASREQAMITSKQRLERIEPADTTRRMQALSGIAEREVKRAINDDGCGNARFANLINHVRATGAPQPILQPSAAQ